MGKDYKPYYIILFLLICFFILGSIVLILPTGKWENNITSVKFISKNKLLRQKGTLGNNVDLNKVVSEVDTTIRQNQTVSEEDTLKIDIEFINFQLTSDSFLSYNSKGEERLIHFFEQLENAPHTKMRILHYGDSQIEGDRMTSFIRQRFQEKFGGIGPGFIPAVNAYNTITFEQTFSDNFVRYTNFGGESLTNDNYGILNTAGRFSKNDDKQIQKGWIEISPSKKAFGTAQQFHRVGLHYIDAKSECIVRIFENDEFLKKDTLNTDGKYHILNLSFEETPQALRFEFEAKESPTILGFSLDGKRGVQVDNIGMRGSSGAFLPETDTSLFKHIIDEQNVQMIILQFGGNAVPMLQDSARARNIAFWLRNQAIAMQQLRPDAVVLFAGPSDMSTLIEEEFKTYPLLPYYIQTLKNAIINSGIVYFDIYEAMGGKESMSVWVENGLASLDHVHFTNEGARIIAQKFYNNLMSSYQSIKEEKASKIEE